MRVDRDNAPDYVGKIVERYKIAIRRRLGIGQVAALVPIPSSSVVGATVAIARWPARRLALVLEAVGLATCCAVVVNEVAMTGKTAGGTKRTADEILDNLELVGPPPDDEPIVLIDDIVTSGASVAAMDVLMGRPADIRAFVVGITDANSVVDAFRSRRFTVEYL